MKYSILIENIKTGEDRILCWDLNYTDDCNQEVIDYVKHMIDYTQNDDGDDLFWKDTKFEDYDWIISYD